MKARVAAVIGTAGCVLMLGLAAPHVRAAVANPVPIPAGAIQVAWRGAPVQHVRVHGGKTNDAVWLANQFNGTGWAYTYSGEMLVVPASGKFIMADFPPANGLPWPGTMGPNSPCPGATITLVQYQLVAPTAAHPPEMGVRVEIQGGGIDVAFDQLLTVIYSYNPGT